MNSKTKSPQIRCRRILDDLNGLDLLDDAVKNRVLERYPEDKLKIIRETNEDKWLPVEYDVELIECLAAEIGDKEVFEWDCRAFAQSIDSTMLGPFFRSALNVFRVTPNTTFKLVPYLWNSIFHNCGHMSVVNKGPGSAQIVLDSMPPIIAGSRPYLLAIAGSTQCLLSFTKSDGQAVLEPKSKETQRAVISLSWKTDT